MEERIDHMKYLPDMEQIESDIPDRVIAEMNGYDPVSYTHLDVYKRQDFHTFDTGIKHGTVSVVINSSVYEITTFRIDEMCIRDR